MKNTFNVLLGLGLLAAIFWGVVETALYLAHKFLKLPQSITIAVIAATVAPIGSVMSLMVGRYFKKKRAVEQEIRAKKTAVYEGLLDLWTIMFMGEKMGKPTSIADGKPNPEFMQKTGEVHRGLVIWSNQEVLRRWSRLRRTNFQPENASKYIVDLELLMHAIREDIGHSNRKLEQGAIMGLHFNDIPVPAEPDIPAKKSWAKTASTVQRARRSPDLDTN
jgi:hypothetical protein